MAHWSEKPDAIRYGVIQVLRNARGGVRPSVTMRYKGGRGGGGGRGGAGGGGGDGGGGGGGGGGCWCQRYVTLSIFVGCIFDVVHALE